MASLALDCFDHFPIPQRERVITARFARP